MRRLAAAAALLLAVAGLSWLGKAPEDSPAGGPTKEVAGAAEGSDAPTRWQLPVPPLRYNAREGRASFRYYCAACHGDEGHGDGINAYNLDPKPRDLADTAFQSKRSDEELRAVIRSGGGVSGLSTGMPPWGRTLSEREIRNIVDYLRTLRGLSDAAQSAPVGSS